MDVVFERRLARRVDHLECRVSLHIGRQIIADAALVRGVDDIWIQRLVAVDAHRVSPRGHGDVGPQRLELSRSHKRGILLGRTRARRCATIAPGSRVAALPLFDRHGGEARDHGEVGVIPREGVHSG